MFFSLSTSILWFSFLNKRLSTFFHIFCRCKIGPKVGFQFQSLIERKVSCPIDHLFPCSHSQRAFFNYLGRKLESGLHHLSWRNNFLYQSKSECLCCANHLSSENEFFQFPEREKKKKKTKNPPTPLQHKQI